MRSFFKFLGWALLLLMLALLLGLGLSLQTRPLVPPPAAISAADVEQAKHFLRRNDPRQLAPGSLGTLRVSEQELGLLLAYLSSRHPRAAARARLTARAAELEASWDLGGSFWLNVRARLEEDAGLPALRDLRLGHLPLPDVLTAWLHEQLLAHLALNEELRLARDLLRHMSVSPGQLQLVYEWRKDSYRRLLDSFMPAADQTRLQVYQQALYKLSRQWRGPVSLSQALPPLFALAAERSATGGDATAENRALLLVLAAQSSGHGLGGLLPAARSWPRPMVEFSLHGRPDFPMHWLISAALSAHAGGPLADAIGLYKEIADTRDGSGFSFNDIAADRAGSRLGLLAVQQPERLQQRLAAGVAELSLLPDVSDLPEFLSAAQFRERYGEIGSPAYQAMQQSIEARLDASPLLAPLLP